MDYKIVKICGFPKEENLEMELEDEVNMYIDMGWKPFGSICVINVGTPKDCEDDDYLIEVWQPMIKEDDNE